MRASDVLVNGKVQRRTILELAKHDAFLHEFVTRWRLGEITWEEMLAFCVVTLSDERARLFDELQAALRNQA